MHLTSSRSRLIVISALALGGALALLTGAGSRSAAPDLAGAAPCTPAKNIYVILDDSGSMTTNDFSRLRVSATDILLSAAANRANGTIYGAGEFAVDFGSIFAPVAVTPNNIPSLAGAVEQKIQEDGSGVNGDFGGGTNYNAAFNGAKAADPNAVARVFMTDGGHNEGTYLNTHTPGPPTYVLGFGTSSSSGALLQQIASDTGGAYFPLTDANELQVKVAEIDGQLSCAKTRAYVDEFNQPGELKSHGLKLAQGSRTVGFTTIWNDATSVFKVLKFVLVRHGEKVASARIATASKVGKLKIKRGSGKTYQTVYLKGRALKKGGRLKFKVKAKQLSLPQTVTTVAAVK
jgi:hypothetical protein